MIVWVNGTFGAGKTATVRELLPLLPGSTAFDPEWVGQGLVELLPPEALAGLRDFQDLVSWRRLVPETAAAMLAELPGPLLVPMTLLRQEYRDEIFGALAARRITVHHVLLHAEEEVLRKRIEADGGSDWRLGHLEAYREALGWLRKDAAVIDTDQLTPRQVAERVVETVASGEAVRAIVQDALPSADTVAAAVLLFDEQGRVLLVDPVYKPGWEFPGGVVESGESPTAAAVRELREELGIPVAAQELRLLAVDWERHRGPRTGGLRLVFDGGVLPAATRAAIRLPDAELRGWCFAGPGEWAELLPPTKLARLRAAVRARDEGRILHCEAGEPLNAA